MSYIILLFFPLIVIFGSKMNGRYKYEGPHIKRIKLFNKILASIMYLMPRSANPEYFVCLLFEYFFQIKVLNQYQNTSKNANIMRYIEKKKHFATP